MAVAGFPHHGEILAGALLKALGFEEVFPSFEFGKPSGELCFDIRHRQRYYVARRQPKFRGKEARL